jgi:hypothetical protein
MNALIAPFSSKLLLRGPTVRLNPSEAAYVTA